jgi:hypothetical protein
MRFAKTERGQQEVKSRELQLTMKQRAALVLCDAKRPGQSVLDNLAAVGSSADDLQALVRLGLVDELPDAEETAAQEARAALQAVPPIERYRIAYPIATSLASTLGLRSFTMTLAVEQATSYEDLCGVATRLRPLVPPEKYLTLHQALYG